MPNSLSKSAPRQPVESLICPDSKRTNRTLSEISEKSPSRITPECDLDTLPNFLKVDEVAIILRVNRKTIYDMKKRGELPSINVGRKLRIPKDAVKQLMTGKARVLRSSRR